MTTPETRNPRVKEAMDLLLKIFDEENLEKVAHAVFRGGDNIPSDKWSFFNRIIMFMHDTEDARGFKQWREAGRFVMKGSKAFSIYSICFFILCRCIIFFFLNVRWGQIPQTLSNA